MASTGFEPVFLLLPGPTRKDVESDTSRSGCGCHHNGTAS